MVYAFNYLEKYAQLCLDTREKENVSEECCIQGGS